MNERIQTIIDQRTEPWGVKVVSVEVKQVDLPDTMLRAMARQAEAEREKRSKIINAEGEFMAAQKLVEAANLLAEVAGHPAAEVPADADGYRRGEEYDDRVSAADGADFAARALDSAPKAVT